MSGSYSHAGVSKLNGEFKVRFCNDALRTKVLQKNGHTGIDIVELRHPMTKADAVAYLLSIDFDNGNKEVRAALEAAADKRGAPAGSKVEKAPKAKAKAAKPVAKKKTTVADAVMKEAKAKVQTQAEAHAKILAEVGEALV
jgi:hypothetical protein